MVAAVLASLVLAACGGGGGDDEAATTEAGAGANADVRVGLVTDIGQLNDRGFNQLAYQGVQQAERDLGITSRVLESASDTDYVPNMSQLAEDGFDVVIGVGFAQGDAVAQVAP